GRLSKAITHRRRLLYVRPNYWILLDELGGTGEHDFEFLYHFAPETQLTVWDEENRGEIECRASIDGTSLQISMYASEPMRSEAVCGQVQPIQGWTSRSYGDRRPSPVFRACVRGCAPV